MIFECLFNTFLMYPIFYVLQDFRKVVSLQLMAAEARLPPRYPSLGSGLLEIPSDEISTEP